MQKVAWPPVSTLVTVLCALVGASCINWKDSVNREGLAVCGNGQVEPGETCDDGNVLATDGCGTECAEETGYTCTGAPSVCASACSPPCEKAFLPSHVAPTALQQNAAELADLTEIDTSSLQLTFSGGSPGPAPNGISFVADANGRAVLSTGQFLVNAPLRIRGSRPLIIVASKEIDVASQVFAHADLETPGPGGFPPTPLGSSPLSTGNGVNGGGDSNGSSGGGGGTYGSSGASGGKYYTVASGGFPGGAYGAELSSFLGGAGGGTAGGSTCGTPSGKGGAGGGAVQLSSAISVLIRATGGVTAGGGGGRAGCSNGFGGGGGGSGGLIFVEAPTLTVLGTLAANGGGGGGGSSDIANGQAGTNGSLSVSQSPGGTGGNGGGDGNGGKGASISGPAQAGGDAANVTGGGGGGGGMGRIWLRTRGTAADVSQGTFTPAPHLDTSASRVTSPTAKWS